MNPYRTNAEIEMENEDTSVSMKPGEIVFVLLATLAMGLIVGTALPSCKEAAQTALPRHPCEQYRAGPVPEIPVSCSKYFDMSPDSLKRP